MSKKNYFPTANLAEAKIIAYGAKDGITHFARRQSDGTVNAKWGFFELMKHRSHDPYSRTKTKYEDYYGPAIAYYK